MMRLTPWTPATDGFVARQDERWSAHLLRRFAVREHGARFWASLWALGVAAVLASLAPAVVDSGPPLRGPDVVFILAAGSFIACGFIAWQRRPDNHSGRLMTATGFAALIYPLLSQFGSPLATTLALLLYSTWTIGYVALLLTFVTGGRPASKVDWALVGAFTFTLVVLQLAWMLFLEREGNLLLVTADAQTAETIDEGRRWLTALSSLAVAVVLAVRWRSASRARRRALLPGVVGGLSAVLFTILLVDGLLAATPSKPLWWLANGALMLVPAAYLAGLLRSRLARGGLAALLLELRTMRGEQLQRALGRAAGDPTLELIDGETTPTRIDGRSVVPIEHEGRRVAALVYDDSLDDDPELVNGIFAAAAIALEHERLLEESRTRLTELRASRERLVTAGDQERRRLERNLHDGAQQRLVAVAMQLQLVQRRIRDNPALAEQLVASATAELALSLEELRELARGLHPAVLDRGLAAALDALAARSPVPTSVSYDAPEALPQQIELAAYFVACEALANVAKYAHATGVDVRVRAPTQDLVIEIADDGVGGADATGGSGLRGLNDRVEALGGRLRVSSAPGAGTVVRAELPLDR